MVRISYKLPTHLTFSQMSRMGDEFSKNDAKDEDLLNLMREILQEFRSDPDLIKKAAGDYRKIRQDYANNIRSTYGNIDETDASTEPPIKKRA